jgi:hypothetical protein
MTVTNVSTLEGKVTELQNENGQSEVSGLFRQPTTFTVSLIDPDKPNWYRVNVHSMSISVLHRHRVDLENKLAGNLPLTQSDVATVNSCLSIVNDRIDAITPSVAAQISDHDVVVSKGRLKERWPAERSEASLLVHYHFSELVLSWNLFPFKRVSAEGHEATVDEYAEMQGITRIAFWFKESREDFLDHFELEDFVTSRQDPKEFGDAFWYVTLSNQFTTEQVNAFLDQYKASMNMLSVIHEERNRAIRTDNGKVGFACVDHFSARERHELNRIQRARQILGEGYRGLNKSGS